MRDLETYGPQRQQTLSLEDSQRYVARVLRDHRENFTVASWLLPRSLRPAFAAVYAYCRWADDLADEASNPQEAQRLLQWWRDELEACFAGHPQHPVFVALQPVWQDYQLPAKPFHDLLDAFVQDQQQLTYDTLNDVIDYCHRSACPVGRLVLGLWRIDDPALAALADHTCIALQLTNFWQDVRRDLVERQRVYIPSDVANAQGLDLSSLCVGLTSKRLPAGYRETIRALCEVTADQFLAGRALWPHVTGRLRFDLKLFTLGGEAVLREIERMDFATLHHRPVVRRGDRLGLVMRALRPPRRRSKHGMPALGDTGKNPSTREAVMP